ncbi:glycosyltransferase family 2 protein [Mediterranea massiliensis]|uniref:glycosyltransferase family 2 protein n=1 Tax=Mediterranea massiliensis TaxID=1841865 RepID=UPI0009334A93|nr:glycosyltransferase family 2 protein [Mediterranea massiliensis]
MKFSIITPVYNREDTICRCIDSITRNLQWGIPIEHIIVDDGSADRTEEYIRSYISNTKHIKFIKFSQNKGTNAARNAAIKNATGEYCIILDSDDYFTNTAIKDIATTIQAHPTYRHYLFVPNDMLDAYQKNPLLKNKIEQVITYQDFLTGKVSGDFIHVIETNILQAFPFDEYLRIYEGVFFLRFYREAQNILFTNKIITIRERSRKDSVTRTTIRTNKDIITRKVIATELYIQWYGNDLKKYGYTDKLYQNYQSLLENLLLLEDYKKAQRIITTDLPTTKPVYKIIYHLRLGNLFRISLAIFLKIKYNILNTQVK